MDLVNPCENSALKTTSDDPSLCHGKTSVIISHVLFVVKAPLLYSAQQQTTATTTLAVHT